MLSRTDFLTKYFTILTGNCLSFHRSHHPPKRFYGGLHLDLQGRCMHELLARYYKICLEYL